MGNNLMGNTTDNQQNNPWFQNLFNASITANVVVTLDSHRIEQVNDRFVALFGRPQSLDLDDSLTKLFPDPAYRKWVTETFERDLSRTEKKPGLDSPSVVQLQTLTGELRHFELHLSRLDTHVLVSLLDVTERIQSIEELRGAKQRAVFLQEILQSIAEAPDYHGALRTALRTICLATESVYGEAWIPKNNEEVLLRGPEWLTEDPKLRYFAEYSKTFSFARGEGLPGQIWKEKKPLWQRDASVDTESVFLRKEGLKHSGLKAMWGLPVQNDKHIIAILVFGFQREVEQDDRLIGTATTIVQAIGTLIERRKSEEELRKLSFAVQQSPISIVITDRRGAIEYVNPRFSQVTGYGIAEVVGKNPRIMKSGEQTRAFYKNLWDTLLAGKMWTGEFINKRKDGTKYVEKASIGPIFDESGKITHFVALKEDITDQKLWEQEIQMAREAAEAANRAKGTFLATMSHEIRTPLNAIIGLSYLAAQSIKDPKEREYIHKINDAGKNLLEIINDILDFSKIEAGKMSIEAVTFNLPTLFKTSIETFSETAALKKVSLESQMDATVPLWVSGDPTRIRQVLNNLLSNAIKFTERGSITAEMALVKSEEKNAVVEFSVTDTGIGMTEGEMKNLFQPFSQADSSMSRKFGGTGLGLAISDSLVKKMGGTIHVESEKGKGSRFTFTVRLNLAEAPEERPITKKNERTHGKTILIVEDNDLNRQIFTELLSSQGYSVISASNGHAALEAIEIQGAQAPGDKDGILDLVLMDLRMPGMDGYETARRIHQIKGLETVPIIAMSADARNTVREEIIAAGMDDFISKPINPPDFFRILERYGGQTPQDRKLPQTDSDPSGPFSQSLFPQRLPALSVADGIRRTGGNVGFYKTLLSDFFTIYRGEIEKLRRLVLEEKYTDLELAAHTLKGAAATIGANEVADVADRIQRNAVQSEEKNRQNELKNQLAELDTLMDTLWGSIDTLQRWSAPQADTTPSVPTPSAVSPRALSSSQREQARALALEIADQLLLDIPRSRQSLESLGILIQGTAFMKDYETLCRLMGEFEIISARSLALKMVRDFQSMSPL